MKKLSTRQLEKMIDGDVVVIDVLPFDSYAKKHLPGAVNVPVGEEDFARQVEGIAGDKQGKVVVYCANSACDASLRAAEKLEAAEFEHVYAFEGGVQAWAEEHLPLEGSEAAAPPRDEWDGNPP
jgi:rhodanese-related sulfurtransferase